MIYFLLKDGFYFNECLHISGISSESLASYSHEYALIGTYHSRLLELIKLPEKDSNLGSAFRSFINAIKTFLKYYHEKIIKNLKNVHEFTIISLHSNYKLIMDQVK